MVVAVVLVEVKVSVPVVAGAVVVLKIVVAVL